MNRTLPVLLATIAATFALVGPTRSDRPILEPWSFLIGEWDVVEHQYESDGTLLETNYGEAQFTGVKGWGNWIQETLAVARETEETRSVRLFAFFNETGEVEVARIDESKPSRLLEKPSGDDPGRQAGFRLIRGTFTYDTMAFFGESPKTPATLRTTYTHTGDDKFICRLEYSLDDSETWRVYSELIYTRKP